jgi:hypothetical protein
MLAWHTAWEGDRPWREQAAPALADVSPIRDGDDQLCDPLAAQGPTVPLQQLLSLEAPALE